MDWNISEAIKYITENQITTIRGLSDGGELYLLSKYNGFFVYICELENLEKKKFELEILGKKTSIFPYVNYGNNYSISITSETINKQIEALNSLANNDCDGLLLDSRVLFAKLPNKDVFKQNVIKLEVNNHYNIDKIIKTIQKNQYSLVSKIETKGQIAVRGDIIDIFPINSNNAYRLSFFDDELESIKTIDLIDYSSQKEQNSIVIVPNSLFLISEEQKQTCIDSIKHIQKSLNLDPNAQVRLDSLCSYCLESINNSSFSMANIWAFEYAFNNTIFDWIPKETLFAFETKKQLYTNLENSFATINDKKRQLFLAGECLPVNSGFEVVQKQIDNFLSQYKNLIFETIIFKSKQSIIEFDCLPSYNYKNKKETLIYDTKQLLEQGYKVVIFCPSELDEYYLTEMFQKQFIHFSLINDINQITDTKLCFFKSNLPFGIVIKNEKLAFIPCGEKNVNKVTYSKSEQPFFELPKSGDYVVHDFHGIGLCLGIQTIEVSNFKRDYVVVQYKGSDKLYLPVENADQLKKYIGEENPKLNQIGGAEFERAKNRVREQMELLAYDMLQIYYDREHTKGHTYEVDTFVDKEFSDAFPYDETPDQITAFEDIKKDMASVKIMDRLICGDVGYGKTEIAFRTAMIAINNGKQVVLLAPTTILSEQHYRSAKSRFAGFGVKIEVLNRFKTPLQVASIQNRLKEGEIDLLIGTQKVLNDSISYKNLGLLILDEEQRLGVNDKEKIKKLKTNLDVLSMSATPIPRTLNMSLTGIRDISIIATAPNKRKSVETTILEYSDAFVFNAIEQEINRSGQVLIITDRIDGIESIASNIKKQFPSINVEFAHAQLTKNQLEGISIRLFSGEIDVLVSTTLIENGIDLPNANTIIVLNADRFGLSQLYQLRGRVGRSDRQAYAYFCFANYKNLSVESSKRLQAIQDFTDLGSGFKIAMRDLELRGAGTVLGEKQSGHLEKVGYDMYCRLLAQALDVVKGKKLQDSSISTKIDIDLDTEIPKWFISNEATRFEIINKISKIDDESSLNKLKESLIETYGNLPQSILNLMEVAVTKNIAQKFAIKSITIRKTAGLRVEIDKNNENSKKLIAKIPMNLDYDVLYNEQMATIISKVGNILPYAQLEKFKKLLINC